MSASTQGQIKFDILYAQSDASSVCVWYNLPSEGTPNTFQFHINIGFIDAGISTVLEA